MARRFAAGGRLFAFGNGGSSTDVATLAALFARPPVGDPLPAWSLAADQAILTALGNDVGFDLVFARQLIARAGPGDIAVAMSTSGNSRDLMAGFREARARGMYTVGFAGLRRRRVRDVVAMWTLLHGAQPERPPDPGGAGRVGGACGRRQDRLAARRTRGRRADGTARPSREAEVIGRIDAFRRRRPRLKDEIITLAHGAGGKSSAALVDAVFVEAFGNELGDGAVLTAPGGRLAMSTDSFVVQPLRFPGGSIGHLAVHGTVNDLAMAGARAALALGRVRAGGGLPDRRAAGDRRRHGRAPPRPRACGWSPATRRSCPAARPTACS